MAGPLAVTASTADVVVVGGGVVGTAIAAQLADVGLGVVLVEAGHLAAGASGAAPGRMVGCCSADGRGSR
jgi:glycerol-3-phosphate dehydrogenase